MKIPQNSYEYITVYVFDAILGSQSVEYMELLDWNAAAYWFGNVDTEAIIVRRIS